MKRTDMFLAPALLVGALILPYPASAQTWSQLPTVGTLPSIDGVVNYDSANNLLILFVPRADTLSEDQVWVLTNANGLGGTATWTQLQPTGTAPTINAAATAVYDTPANQLIVYGGCGGDCSPALSGVYVLSHANGLGGTPAWSQRSPNIAIAREDLAAVFDPTTNSMIAFGGGQAFFGTDTNQTNVFVPGKRDSPTWTTLTPSGGPPGVREGNSAVYDHGNNMLIVFGGEEGINPCCPYNIFNYNDVWVLSNANGQGGTPTWTQLLPEGSAPQGRNFYSNSGVYDQRRNILYVFGGDFYSNDTQSHIAFGDLWRLTNANGLSSSPPAWAQIGQLGTPPGATDTPALAFDAANERIILLAQVSCSAPSVYILDLTQH